MAKSGMDDINSDANKRGWSPKEKKGVDLKKVTSALM